MAADLELVTAAKTALAGVSEMKAILANPELDRKERQQEILVALIKSAKYMTGGTAVTPDAVAKDAADDTRRMKAAFDEICRVFAV